MSFDSFRLIREGVLQCKTCGREVPSGIFNISGHWAECTGKDFTKAVMQKAERTNGRLSEFDIHLLANDLL